MTALELGLVAPMLLLLMFGIVQHGYHYWSLTTASATAREAARRMSVGNEWGGCAERWIAEHASHPAVEEGTVRSSFRWADTAGNTLAEPRAGQLVAVTVSFRTLDLGIPFLPLPGGGEVTQTAVARVQNVPETPPPCEAPGNP